MRKTGFAVLLSGVLLSGLLFLVRRTDWYGAEVARGMSDFAELVESAFWAALLLTLFGVFLLLLSLRPTERLPENETPAPLARTWVCPACGQVNPETEGRCAICGALRNGEPLRVWRCELCGAENPETSDQCGNCGSPKERPLLTWICEGCGRENPETETRCTAGQRRRFPKAVTWTCPACHIANPEEVEVCRLCGRARTRNTWACAYCGTRNAEGRAVCGGCGRPKGARARSWLCAVCGTQNRADRAVCVGCGQPRP